MRSFLQSYVRRVDGFNRWLGESLAWCLPIMTAVTLTVILGINLFRVGWIWMSELVIYMHGILFTLAAAYTLLHDDHVRIDLFYAKLSERRRAWINLIGVFALLIPSCVVIFVHSLPYVIDSWSVRETSTEGQGLPLVFLLKTCLLIMPALLTLQGLSLAAKSLLLILDRRSP